MAAMIVLGVGGLLVVTGLGVLLGMRVDIAAFLRLRRTPTPITEISGPGEYHVRGRAVVSEQGTLQSPLTGREALVYRIAIRERQHAAGSRREVRVDNACGEVDFLVDDASGRRLRVCASEALFALDRTELFDGLRPSSATPPAEILEWITRRLGAPRSNVSVDERIIEPNQLLSLIGPVSVDNDEQGGQQQKMTSPTTGALFITSPTDGSGRRVVRNVVIAAVLVVVGCAAGLVGGVVL